MAGTVLIFLRQPDLVAPKRMDLWIAQDIGVVGVEHELCTMRIGLGILKQVQQAGDEMRMKAGIDLVNKENASLGQRLEHRPYESNPHTCALRLVFRVERHGASAATVHELKLTLNQDFFVALVIRAKHACDLPQPIEGVSVRRSDPNVDCRPVCRLKETEDMCPRVFSSCDFSRECSSQPTISSTCKA